MPCDSGYMYPGEYSKLEDRISHLTALLCSACRELQAHHVPLPPDVEAWWKQHEADDKARSEAALRHRDVTRERLRRVIRDAESELKALK